MSVTTAADPIAKMVAPEVLKNALLQILPAERVKMRLIDRYAYACDASHFYLVPQAVAQPQTIAEVQQLFALSKRLGISLTFRTAGTSFSGQGVTDGLLVDLSNYWRRVRPEEDGKQVRFEPAVIGAYVNLALKKHGRKMGPDPASINAAMMGGILSNNSSGMCCGVANNAYHTLRYLTFVLPDGNQFSTEKPEDYARFLQEEPRIAAGLQKLREEARSNPALTARIRQKYRQKNTVGYCINAFLDYEHPLDILAHLIVGGEGTLAFIAEAVLQTIPDLPFKITGMLYFDSPASACNAIPALRDTGAEALEFMDRASLQSVEDMPGVPAFLKDLPQQASAILCEFQAATQAEAAAKYEAAEATLSSLPLLIPYQFTQDAGEQALYWKIRKGMYPSAAGMRAKGTSCLLEDITFPVERLGDAVVDVQKLFGRHGYTGIIFGHAKDGNLHFAVEAGFASQADVDRYEKFNDDLFNLVLDKYDGALKGEHSTGRAVSAYVEKEWGPDAYRIMKALKQLIDPDNLLNPGIIITADPLTHIHDLKIMPVVEEEVDKCVECGFCESSCPSRDFTLTPRRRIVLRRALKRLEASGDTATRQAILKDYAYDGLETCAVDGMCAVNCPVDINTGELVKRLRRENHSSFQNRMALRLARNFKWLERFTRIAIWKGLFFNRLLGKNFMKGLTSSIRKLIPQAPLWSNHIQRPAKTRIIPPTTIAEAPGVVYFCACINRMMGGDIFQRMESLCRKAGIDMITTSETLQSCCGQIFSSKGYADAYKHMANQTVEQLWNATRQGALPVVLDVSSCTQTLLHSRPYLTQENQQRFDNIQLLDIVDFAADWLLPRLHISRPKEKVVFHPVCSVQKMGTLPKLQAIGRACAKQADIPVFAACCGMAGDRGMYYPGLTSAATKRESDEVKQQTYEGYYSTSTTCEMALSESVGAEYTGILTLLDESSD